MRERSTVPNTRIVVLGCLGSKPSPLDEPKLGELRSCGSCEFYQNLSSKEGNKALQQLGRKAPMARVFIQEMWRTVTSYHILSGYLQLTWIFP
jgi:hypothetical protein